MENKKPTLRDLVKILKEEIRPIYNYKMLQRIHCDLDSAVNNPNPQDGEYCRIIAESKDYLFYSYMAHDDNSGGYVIRRTKAKMREKRFFGKNYKMSCVFEPYLFQCNSYGERGRFFIYAKNMETGEETKCDWLGKGDVFLTDSGFGRFYVQDVIKSVDIENGQLVFHVHRNKSSAPEYVSSTEGEYRDDFDFDTDYKLIITLESGELRPVAVFDTDTVIMEN